MAQKVFILALILSLASPLTAEAQRTEATPNRSEERIRKGDALTPAQRRRADQIISAFENDTIELQYGYSEVLHDGRGLTAGRAGFTTGTGDLLIVVKRYLKKVPGSPLKTYLPRLEELAKSNSDSVEGAEDLGRDWKEASKDPVFCKAQDEIVDELYFRHAVKWGKKVGVRSPLGLLFLYDTVIQHGDGRDLDGLGAIVKRTTEEAAGDPKSGIDEKIWLATFIKQRRETLANSHGEATRKAWAESVVRCDVLRKIAEDGDYELKGPIRIKPYRMEFVIE